MIFYEWFSLIVFSEVTGSRKKKFGGERYCLVFMSSAMVPWKDCGKVQTFQKIENGTLWAESSAGIAWQRPINVSVGMHFKQSFFFVYYVKNKEFIINPSSETQGQIVGKREALNGRENVARRKVKNGEKSPWGQCLTRPVPNGRRSLLFFVPYIFFRPFRLSLVPFICPWVSEDVINPDDRMFFLFTTSPSIVDNKLRFLSPKARQAHYDDYVLCT